MYVHTRGPGIMCWRCFEQATGLINGNGMTVGMLLNKHRSSLDEGPGATTTSCFCFLNRLFVLVHMYTHTRTHAHTHMMTSQVAICSWNLERFVRIYVYIWLYSFGKLGKPGACLQSVHTCMSSALFLKRSPRQQLIPLNIWFGWYVVPQPVC